MPRGVPNSPRRKKTVEADQEQTTVVEVTPEAIREVTGILSALGMAGVVNTGAQATTSGSGAQQTAAGSEVDMSRHVGQDETYKWDLAVGAGHNRRYADNAQMALQQYREGNLNIDLARGRNAAFLDNLVHTLASIQGLSQNNFGFDLGMDTQTGAQRGIERMAAIVAAVLGIVLSSGAGVGSVSDAAKASSAASTGRKTKS